MIKVAGSPVLAGALHGRRAFASLLEATVAEPPEPEPVFLDFEGVEVATASYLRESVLAFRDTVRGRRSNLYPILANAAESVREELGVLVGSYGDVLLLCRLSAAGAVSDPQILGVLDPKQRLTFDLVCKHGETDAGELMREHGAGEEVKQTAWNNRLAALADLGLAVEVRHGRAKRYRPLLIED
jgi:hypothetical protein